MPVIFISSFSSSSSCAAHFILLPFVAVNLLLFRAVLVRVPILTDTLHHIVCDSVDFVLCADFFRFSRSITSLWDILYISFAYIRRWWRPRRRRQRLMFTRRRNAAMRLSNGIFLFHISAFHLSRSTYFVIYYSYYVRNQSAICYSFSRHFIIRN